MKRKTPFLFLLLLIAGLLLPACGGGGDTGDNMNDYWVSAARFANGTKKIRLIGGMGSAVVEVIKPINIGPEDLTEVGAEATEMPATTAQFTTEGMAGFEGKFIATGTTYKTDPVNKRATLEITTLEQPLGGDSGNLNESDVTAHFVELFGALGREKIGANFIYYTIEGRVVIELDFNTGLWTVTGKTDQPADLHVEGARFNVIRAY